MTKDHRNNIVNTAITDNTMEPTEPKDMTAKGWRPVTLPLNHSELASCVADMEGIAPHHQGRKVSFRIMSNVVYRRKGELLFSTRSNCLKSS